MIQRRSTGTLVLLLSILCLLWVVSAFAPRSRPPGSVSAALMVRHAAQGGMHTYSGVIDARCPLGVSITAWGPEPRVRLALSASGSDCGAMTAQEFSASVTAAAPELQGITLNGAPVAVRLVNQ